VDGNEQLSASGVTRRRLLLLGMSGLAVSVLPGCSLFVMAGKMFFGDPKQKCQFRRSTGVDLTKGEKKLLIACTAPHGVLNKFPAIQIDLVDRISHLLKTRGVKVVDSDDVATWLDDNGHWGDFGELSARFKADYVVHVQITTFEVDVPNSSNLQQGRMSCRVEILDCKKTGSPSGVFDNTYDMSYPKFPIQNENKSERIFLESFMKNVSTSLAQLLYDHRASEVVS